VILNEVSNRFERAPVYLAASAVAAAIVSIVASEILMALALVALFVPPRAGLSNTIRWPAVTAPLLLWMVWTLVSLAASGHTREGLPQIKKFIWFVMLFVVYNAIRELCQIRGTVVLCAITAALSSAWAMVQFARKYHAAQLLHRNFYSYYVADRITGFMGHWMTFSGQMMMALVLLAALILFSRDPRGKAWLGAAAVLIAIALYFAETRSMWGGAVAGVVYLLWFSRRWLIVALPVIAALLYLTSPFDVRERMISIVRPHGDMDSNQHRAVLRRIGVEMIRAHPLLGVGPEQVGKQYQQYIPPDIPRPLPTGYYGHLHNIYFHYAAERGLPALAALLWFLGRALYDFARALRRLSAPDQPAQGRLGPRNDQELRSAPPSQTPLSGRVPWDTAWVLHGAIAVILAMMVGGYEEVNLGDSEVLAMFLGVVGLGYAAVSIAADSDSASARR
jgi:putative inorganic carbon (HCO3(-)) transporter